MRKGLPSVPKPRILGADGAGVVEASPGYSRRARRDQPGPRARRRDPRDRRAHRRDARGAGRGPGDERLPAPGRLSFEEAAAFPLVFETAYRMLVTRAALQEGEWVLIWGIGGGVATAAFPIAQALGARDDRHVLERREARAARELGADATVNHATGDVVAAVKEATGGEAPTSSSRRRRGDVEAHARGRAPGRAGRRLRRDDRPEPAGARCTGSGGSSSIFGSTMGTRADFEGAYDLVAAGRATPTSTTCSRWAKPVPPTSASRRASSSARSCSRFPNSSKGNRRGRASPGGRPLGEGNDRAYAPSWRLLDSGSTRPSGRRGLTGESGFPVFHDPWLARYAAASSTSAAKSA